MNIINNSEVLGSLSKDLVLNTLGKVYIRVGDRYHELDFKSVIQKNEDPEIKEIIEEEKDSDVLIVNSISNLEYPGDNKLVVSLDGNFFATINGKFKPINKSIEEKTSSNSFAENDIYLHNKIYSDNLIVDFSAGEISSDVIGAENLLTKRINHVPIDYILKERFIRGSGDKVYIGPEVRVKYAYQENEDGIIYTYFVINPLENVSLFPIDEIIIDDQELFNAKIIEVDSDYIKTVLVENDDGVIPEFEDIENIKFIMIKGDFIKYDNY